MLRQLIDTLGRSGRVARAALRTSGWSIYSAPSPKRQSPRSRCHVTRSSIRLGRSRCTTRNDASGLAYGAV